jgi:hypothetical protein
MEIYSHCSLKALHKVLSLRVFCAGLETVGIVALFIIKSCTCAKTTPALMVIAKGAEAITGYCLYSDYILSSKVVTADVPPRFSPKVWANR